MDGQSKRWFVYFVFFCLVTFSCQAIEVDISTTETIEIVGIRFATWNIAHFNLGSYITNSIDTEEKYNCYLPVYQRIVKDVQADFFNICEFETPFFAGNANHSTEKELFADYQYYKYGASSVDGFWVAFFFSLPD